MSTSNRSPSEDGEASPVPVGRSPRAESDEQTVSPSLDSKTGNENQPNNAVSNAPPLPNEPLPTSTETSQAPPLPNEPAPPLPAGPPPGQQADDGWDYVWDENVRNYYFYNRITHASQWENPRVPEVTAAGGQPLSYNGVPGVDQTVQQPTEPLEDRPRYNPAIHGSYDPEADYAQYDKKEAEARARQEDIAAAIAAGADPTAAAAAVDGYAASGQFNRFTGKWQRADLNPENFNDEAKSNRQQRAFFDVELAANSHDGRSLKAERSGKKLSKDEVKAFKDKRRAKKEEKRRAWLRD